MVRDIFLVIIISNLTVLNDGKANRKRENKLVP